MKAKKVVLGADHAGFELKEEVKEFLQKENYKVEDKGAYSFDREDDYPDFIIPAAEEVSKDPQSVRGIVFGGSGQGEAIAANKVKKVRAALYYGHNKEIVKLSRTHNNANVLSLGARFLSKKEAFEVVKLWLETDFKGEGRHSRRIKKVSASE